MGWVTLACEALEYGLAHRKEIAESAEIGVHVLRRIEHLIVKHNTTADQILVAAEKGLHDYNTHSGEK